MNSAISDELLDIISIPGIIRPGNYYHQIYKTLIVGKDLLPITTASMIGHSPDSWLFQSALANAEESIINNIGVYTSFLIKEKLIDPPIKEEIMNNLQEISKQIKTVKSQTGGRDIRVNKKIGQYLLKNGMY